MAAPVSNPRVVGLLSVAARFTTVPVTEPAAVPASGALPVPVPVPAGVPAPAPALLLGAGPEPGAAALPSTTTQSSGSPAFWHGEGCGASSSTMSLPSFRVGFSQPLDRLGVGTDPGILLD